MSLRLRMFGDRAFTALAVLSIVGCAAVLVVILGPMLWRGAEAVVFTGTVEFRQMQLNRYGRGDPAAIAREVEAAREARRPVYELLDGFSRGIDVHEETEEAKHIYDELGKQLMAREAMDRDERLKLERKGRRIRDDLIAAFEETDKATARDYLDDVLHQQERGTLEGTVGVRFYDLARRYGALLETADLELRATYAEPLAEVKEAVRLLFGPPPGRPMPLLAMNQYGATRMSMADRILDDLYYAEAWVQVEPGKPLEKKRIPREEQFAGTPLAALFPMVRENLDAMMLPERTVYWQYFIDDSVPGHFFGGVGPEVLGTLSLTVLAMLFAFPLGVISAAYLVEVAGDGRAVRMLRMCINTLAGVPSIVFGLFGLAFFVLFIVGKPCVLAASLTLGVLVLPVIIRASEEAIRAVPPTYKEAALALGASRLRCFVTVQLPAALPGILTGAILSMSRAAGETAPILFTGAVALGASLKVADWPPWNFLFQPTRALSYGSYDVAVSDRIASMVPHQQFGMVMTLVALVLLLNLTAIIIRWRISRKLRGT